MTKIQHEELDVVQAVRSYVRARIKVDIDCFQIEQNLLSQHLVYEVRVTLFDRPKPEEGLVLELGTSDFVHQRPQALFEIRPGAAVTGYLIWDVKQPAPAG